MKNPDIAMAGASLANDGNLSVAADRIGLVLGPMLSRIPSDVRHNYGGEPHSLNLKSHSSNFAQNEDCGFGCRKCHQRKHSEKCTEAAVKHFIQAQKALRSKMKIVTLIHGTATRSEWSRVVVVRFGMGLPAKNRSKLYI